MRIFFRFIIYAQNRKCIERQATHVHTDVSIHKTLTKFYFPEIRVEIKVRISPCQQRREKELVTGSRKGLRYSFLCLYCPSERWLPGKLFDGKLFRVYFMWNHCNVNEEETTFPRYVQLRAYAVYIRSAFDNEKWVMVDGKPFQSCQLSVKLCNNFLFVS